MGGRGVGRGPRSQPMADGWQATWHHLAWGMRAAADRRKSDYLEELQHAIKERGVVSEREMRSLEEIERESL